MKKYLEILKRCPLFHAIAEPDLLAMLSCLGATVHPYEKNEPILTEGDAASRLGILLSGTAQIIRIDLQIIIIHLQIINICLKKNTQVLVDKDCCELMI